MQEAIATRPNEVQEKLEMEARVFQQAYIPRTLDQVVDLERDVQRAQRGEKQEVQIYFSVEYHFSSASLLLLGGYKMLTIPS